MRVSAGVTQAAIAERLGRDIRTVQRYEAGEQSPTREDMRTMAEQYNCEVADLFWKEVGTKGGGERTTVFFTYPKKSWYARMI